MSGPHQPSRFARRTAALLRCPSETVELWERLILTAFAVTLIVFGARALHLLDVGEAWWLDRMANADRPDFDAPVTVVAITDESYYDAQLFGGQSPLDPAALLRILEGTLAHSPRGVILDVFIHPAPGESPARAADRRRLFAFLAARPADPPLVLVRNPDMEARERRADDGNWTAFDALTHDRDLAWATPAIRRSGGYVRAVPQRYEPAVSTLPTVLGAAVAAFSLEPHRTRPWWFHHESPDPLLPWRIRYSGEFLDLAGRVTPHCLDAAAVLTPPSAGSATSILRDQIVLIGGTHYAGRDILSTVVGDMAGVFVWAEAIASWMRHDALREPMEALAFALEFLIGVAAGLLFARFGPALGLLFALLVVGPLMVLFSLLTFGDRVLFVNFMPSFVAVYLHYQIEVHVLIRELKLKLKRLTPSPSPAADSAAASPD